MSETKRGAPPTYTAEQRIALVTEIDRRFRAGEGTLRAIAQAAGTTDTNYHNWVRSGIKPATMAMRPVEITTSLVPVPPAALTIAPAPKAAPAKLTLAVPGGYRLEGLCVETAAALLKALS